MLIVIHVDVKMRYRFINCTAGDNTQAGGSVLYFSVICLKVSGSCINMIQAESVTIAT